MKDTIAGVALILVIIFLTPVWGGYVMVKWLTEKIRG